MDETETSAGVPLQVLDPDTTAKVQAMAESILGHSHVAQLPKDDDDLVLSLRSRIRAHMRSGTLELVITDNCYTMISVKRSGLRYRLRLHHMFLSAPPAVTRAVARYVTANDRDASRLLGDFIENNTARIRERTPPKNRRLVSYGDNHDLQEIYDELNRKYFRGAVDARITWGQKSKRRRRRTSIKMGSYSPRERLIRIHRALDREFVPRFFVAWVVYHEMLHQLHPVRVTGGRRQVHPPEFLADEKRFVHFKAATAWQDKHLGYLLNY